MRRRFLAAGAMAGLLAFSLPAPVSASSNIDLLAIALGWYDMNDNEDAVDFRLEYRFGNSLVWDLKPWFGIEASTDGALFGLGGILYDWEVIDDWYVVPSFGAGLYADGGGKDLGDTIEFRSQLEIQYEFEDNSRFSVGFSHISNAGFDDDNPGTEVLSIYYSIPLDRIF